MLASVQRPMCALCQGQTECVCLRNGREGHVRSAKRFINFAKHFTTQSYRDPEDLAFLRGWSENTSSKQICGEMYVYRNRTFEIKDALDNFQEVHQTKSCKHMSLSTSGFKIITASGTFNSKARRSTILTFF